MWLLALQGQSGDLLPPVLSSVAASVLGELSVNARALTRVAMGRAC